MQKYMELANWNMNQNKNIQTLITENQKGRNKHKLLAHNKKTLTPIIRFPKTKESENGQKLIAR